jgi:1-phosphatidylinositol-4-phosphate 5-kinase
MSQNTNDNSITLATPAGTSKKDSKEKDSYNVSSLTTSEKKKIGHREVKGGVVHYKKISTDELKKSIQFGIVHFINEQNRLNSKYNIERDLLMQDFQVVEPILYPKTGSANTPAHDFNDFKLIVYAPYGFKYLRRKFNVNEVDFMHALGETDLKEISNPGASGSVFYKTSNDKYILKTVQYQECEFLKTLLAGYALNLLQNLINGRYSLLPTIYGLYCYQKTELTSMLSSDKTNIRVVIMNNILPSDIPMHEKYDLKGSLYKRKASRSERSKSSPTFKDLDFLDEHKEGLILDEKHYENVISSIKRDCLILQSFGIMDYSLLIGVHNLEKEKNNQAIEAYYEAKISDQLQSTTSPNLNTNSGGGGGGATYNPRHRDSNISRNYTPASPLTTKYNSNANNNNNSSTLSNNNKQLENIFNISAVPAKSAKGDRLLLYFGIIDILQSYRLKKRLEHTFKSMITDGVSIYNLFLLF